MTLAQVSPTLSYDTQLVKVVGKAEIYYTKKKNLTRASSFAYLLGNEHEKESLSVFLHYVSTGTKAVQPTEIRISFTFLSGEPKYKGNHGITLFVDGEKFLFDPLFYTVWTPKFVLKNSVINYLEHQLTNKFKLYESEKFSLERYTIVIDDKLFQRLVNAKAVEFQLGDTKVPATPDALRAIHDLDKTIEP